MSSSSSQGKTVLEGDTYGGPLIAKSSSTTDTQKTLIYVSGALIGAFIIYKVVTKRK